MFVVAAHLIDVPRPSQRTDGRLLLYAQLRHLARTLEDIEKLRIQHSHRREAFVRDHELALPLPPDSVSDALATAEHGAELELKRLFRQLPAGIVNWQKQTAGVGEKQLARLVGEIGDPAARPNVAKLWAYCGYDPTRRRRKGMSQEEALACGNSFAKSRCRLIAEKCVTFDGKPDKRGRPRARSPYRNVYELRREATLDRDWTDGHKHSDALRIVAKTILKDLWAASRHAAPDAHDRSAASGPEDA